MIYIIQVGYHEFVPNSWERATLNVVCGSFTPSQASAK